MVANIGSTTETVPAVALSRLTTPLADAILNQPPYCSRRRCLAAREWVAPPVDVGRATAFLDALPSCTPEVEHAAVAIADALGGELPRAVSVRGSISVGDSDCTLKECVGKAGDPAPSCCNSCGGDWVLRDAEGAKESAVALLDGYNKPLLTYSVMDCRLKELHALPRFDVVATGTLRVATHLQNSRGEVTDAHVCRIRSKS